MEQILKVSAGFIGAAVSYLFGGWGALIAALLTMVAFDYVTGIFAAASEGKLSSKVGLVGIARKVFIFVVVSMAHMVDVVLDSGSNLVRDGVIFFYIANEALSVLENGGRMGVKGIPPVIKQAIEVLKGKSGEKKDGDKDANS